MMKIFNGNLIMTSANIDQYKKLEKVSGYIYVSENAKLSLPKLVESGYIDVRENAKLSLPKLEKVSGSIDVSENAKLSLPKLVESGYIYVSENAKLSLPKLVIQNNVAKINNKKYNVIYNDNIDFFVENERTSKGIKIYSGLINLHLINENIVGDRTYLTTKGGFSAHGETLKLAILDLQFKIISEQLKKEPINKDTEITVEHYRVITGACELGVKQFMDKFNLSYKEINGKLKETNPIKAIELLPMLEKDNSYGLNKFRELITF